MEDRGAGAGLADDDDRRHDVGVGDLGVLLAPLDDPEPGREVVDDLAGGDLLAELVQPGLVAQRVDELLEPGLPGGFAEVVEAGAFERERDESVGIEREVGHRVFLTHARTGRIDAAN